MIHRSFEKVKKALNRILWLRCSPYTYSLLQNIRAIHLGRYLLTKLILISLFLSTATAQISVTPVRAILEEPGAEMEFRVTNPSQTDITINASWLDMVALENGSYRHSTNLERSKMSAAPHLTIYPAQLYLPANGSGTIKITVTRPPDSSEKRSHLYLETSATPQHNLRVSSNLPLDMATGVSVPVIVRTNTQPIINDLKIKNAELSRTPGGGLAFNIGLSRSATQQAPKSIFGELRINMTSKNGQSYTLAKAKNISIYHEVIKRNLSVNLGVDQLPEGTVTIEFIENMSGAETPPIKAIRQFKIGPPRQ